MYVVVVFKKSTVDEMRISDWSSDVCSSDLVERRACGLTFAAAPSNRAPSQWTPHPGEAAVAYGIEPALIPIWCDPGTAEILRHTAYWRRQCRSARAPRINSTAGWVETSGAARREIGRAHV